MNMAASARLAPALAPANSFHTKIPQSEATSGALWPMAYDTANPTALPATRFEAVPVAQMAPPRNPSKCQPMPPREYSRIETGTPINGRRIRYKLKGIVETSAATAKTAKLARGVKACADARIEEAASGAQLP